ncbi:MAG TPA: hypothetical protein PKE39_01675 [Ignavibacteria bacterium]|nr:hypothetical protein [Ignavibacteria bacterium]HMQ97708.1 hypothetical protein [Ignavibacteria bacterium]
MKKHFVVSAKFDLPFYLRLPSNRFLSYDEKHKICVIIPLQRLGEKIFNKKTKLAEEQELLDDPQIHELTTRKILGYDYKVVSDYNDKQITTLETRIQENGGFTQLQAYTEITMFIYVLNENPKSEDIKKRLFANLNHFLKIYKLVTQDPFITKIDKELNLYYVDWGIGKIKETAKDQDVNEILWLKDVIFSSQIGEDRGIQLQTNSIEDLYPGSMLDQEYLQIFANSILGEYELPLFYDLILEAQRQLKFRNFHIAIIEAQSAFESYTSQLLTTFFKREGLSLEQIANFFQDNMFHKRLKILDGHIANYKNLRGELYNNFINSNLYLEWKEDLYRLRNKIVHEGFREIDFESTRDAISITKDVIFHFEKTLPEFSNTVQI